MKYLSEEGVEKPVARVSLVASPYRGTENWEVDECVLQIRIAGTRLPLTFAGATNGSIREVPVDLPGKPIVDVPGAPDLYSNIHPMDEGNSVRMTYNHPEDLSDPKEGWR